MASADTSSAVAFAFTPDPLPKDSGYPVDVAIYRRKSPAAAAEPQTESDAKPPLQLLVLKRFGNSPAFPNHWELPNGYVEGDKMGKDTVFRETLEKMAFVSNPDRTNPPMPHLKPLSMEQTNDQFKGFVRVKEPIQIQHDPEKYTESRWIDEEEGEKLPMTPTVRQIYEITVKFGKDYVASFFEPMQ